MGEYVNVNMTTWHIHVEELFMQS